MYIVLCNYKLKPGSREELLNGVRKENLEARLHAQPGNIEYSFLIPPGQEDVLRIVEVWEKKEDFDAHKNCEATAAWRKLNAGLIEGMDNHRYQTAEQNQFT